MDRALFDDQCAFCKACVDWARRRHAEVAFEPCRPGTDGLTAADCARTAWVIRVDGSRLAGAPAVAYVLRRLPGRRNIGWRILGRVMAVPPLSWLAALGYRVVAANRGRLPAPSRAARRSRRP